MRTRGHCGRLFGDFGVRRLDLLVVTHFHNDHANGAARLLERMEVGCWPSPMWDQESPIRQELLSAAERTGTGRCGSSRSDTALELDGGADGPVCPRWARGDQRGGAERPGISGGL